MADVISAPSAHGTKSHHASYLVEPKGLKSWLTTVDHKRLGIMYLASISFAFFLGGIFALLVRLSLLNPKHVIFGHVLMSAETYNKAFTLHGAIMVFLFIIPSIPAAMGNFVLPLMLGAKDVAFPRLNLFSYYIFVLGAVLAILALFLRGADTGWTFYTPYSIRTNTTVIYVLFGAFIAGFSSILTGLN